MSKVITILLLGFAAYYWSQTQKLKALAIQAVRRRCREAGVQFLDHTVVHHRRRIRRDEQGRLGLEREYLFDFTSTGESRYQGKVILFGKSVVGIELEAFPIN